MVVDLKTKNKIILFRGGMCGDHILSLLDKNYLRSQTPRKLQLARIRMKQYYKYTQEQKDQYYKNIDGYTLSHDTEYCKTRSDDVVQIVCTDETLFEKFSFRFWTRNGPDNNNQLNHVISDIKSDWDNKVTDYKNDLLSWQKSNVFKQRFDIKNVFTERFVDQLAQQFEIANLDWATQLHSTWLQSQS